jgi:hypothetical protein
MGALVMFRRVFFSILGSAAALAAPVVASATVIHLNSPKDGDKLLARESAQGRGPPAQGLWTNTVVTVDPKTGAKTTTTIVANHPVPDPPRKATVRQPDR